jgi:hypothetical protein
MLKQLKPYLKHRMETGESVTIFTGWEELKRTNVFIFCLPAL